MNKDSVKITEIQNGKIELNKENEIKKNIIINNLYKEDKTKIPSKIFKKKCINDLKFCKIIDYNNKCLFDNKEIKKYINDEDKKLHRKNNINSAKKINIKNIKNIKIFENNKKNALNNNKSLPYKVLNKNNNDLIDDRKITFSEKRSKIELKEQSTNTSNNYLILNDINNDNDNNLYSINPTICPKEQLREENNYLNNKQFMKTNNNINKYLCSIKNLNIFNKINKNYFSQSYMLTPNNNYSKLDYIRDILIDNNIKNSNEINKNRFKYYTHLYNFNLAQSILQNKGLFFNMKNTNNLPFYIVKTNNNNNNLNFNNELNINNYFCNLNNLNNINNFSIRELYRNLNNENHSPHSHLNNKNKKNNKKKRIKKSFEYKIKKNNNNNSKRKFNLTNLQYDYKSDKNKYPYENLFLTKRYTHFSFNKNIKNDIKDEYHYFKRKKSIGNYFENLLKKKNINDIQDDILEIGLVNSSSQQKIEKKK